jgi:hypothetical protein
MFCSLDNRWGLKDKKAKRPIRAVITRIFCINFIEEEALAALLDSFHWQYML